MPFKHHLKFLFLIDTPKYGSQFTRGSIRGAASENRDKFVCGGVCVFWLLMLVCPGGNNHLNDDVLLNKSLHSHKHFPDTFHLIKVGYV